MQASPLKSTTKAQLHEQDKNQEHSVNILQIGHVLRKLFYRANMKKAADGYFSLTTNKGTLNALVHQTRSQRLQNIKKSEYVNQEIQDPNEGKKIQVLHKWTWFNRIH